MRMPLPPPPAAALTSSGKPTRRGVAHGSSEERQRRHSGLTARPLCGELVAHAPRSRRATARPRRGRPSATCGRILRSRTGSRSRDGSASAPAARAAAMIALAVEVATVVEPDRLVGLGDERRVRVGVDVHGDAADAHVVRAVRKTRRAISPRLATRTEVMGLLTVGTLRSSRRPRSARLRTTERQSPSDGAGVSGVDDAVVADGTGGGECERAASPALLRPWPRCARPPPRRTGSPFRAAWLRRTIDMTPAICLRPHHRDLGGRPEEREAIAEGAPGHRRRCRRRTTGTDDHREVRHRRVGDSVDHLRALLDDAAASKSRPTMKPVTFCRNTSGTSIWLQSWMKWAAFSAASG